MMQWSTELVVRTIGTVRRIVIEVMAANQNLDLQGLSRRCFPARSEPAKRNDPIHRQM